ncbi:MAG: protein jag [Eubacteriaceae bacterium]|nr:protein jag [Eubacteriaceae bacterium]
MKSIVTKAKTIDDAVNKALAELGVGIDDVTVNVLETPSTGLIGVFGNRQAKVEVIVKDSAAETASAFLADVFGAMGIEVQIDSSVEDEVLVLSLSSPKAGILIGKRGATLDALQYLTSLAANKAPGQYQRIVLDIESYREKRKRALQDLADRIALNVAKRRSRHALEPMNPYERRIIHSSLQNYKNISTYSEGEEPNRHVVIEYKREQV